MGNFNLAPRNAAEVDRSSGEDSESESDWNVESELMIVNHRNCTRITLIVTRF